MIRLWEAVARKPSHLWYSSHRLAGAVLSLGLCVAVGDKPKSPVPRLDLGTSSPRFTKPSLLCLSLLFHFPLYIRLALGDMYSEQFGGSSSANAPPRSDLRSLSSPSHTRVNTILSMLVCEQELLVHRGHSTRSSRI